MGHLLDVSFLAKYFYPRFGQWEKASASTDTGGVIFRLKPEYSFGTKGASFFPPHTPKSRKETPGREMISL